MKVQALQMLKKTEWLFVCLALAATLFCPSAHLRQGLEGEHRLSAKRLAHAFIPLLAKAHHAKDDLALQEAVSALAQAPGVSLACVIDAEEKVLAHSRLSQIGKAFELPKHAEHLQSFPLKDGAGRWGTLLFSLSITSSHQLWLEELGMFSVFLSLLAFAYVLRRHIEARRIKALTQAYADQTLLWEEERQEKEKGIQELADTQRQSRLWFQALLEKIPEPVLLLDARQRVSAFNFEAGQLLKLGPKENWENASWQDVPWLQEQGAALEQSLQKPGMDILTDNGVYEAALRTEPPWTWVKPRSALRVYQ